jgi:hypothetical protein
VEQESGKSSKYDYNFLMLQASKERDYDSKEIDHKEETKETTLHVPLPPKFKPPSGNFKNK